MRGKDKDIKLMEKMIVVLLLVVVANAAFPKNIATFNFGGKRQASASQRLLTDAYNRLRLTSQNGAYVQPPSIVLGDTGIPIGITSTKGDVRLQVRGLSDVELKKVLNLEIYRNIDRSFNSACDVNNGIGKEIQEVWYQDRNGYLCHERVDNGMGTSTNVKPDSNKIDQIVNNGGTIYAIVHNHPVGDSRINCGAWPSNIDAKNLRYEQYIVDCTKDAEKRLVRFSSRDGKVYAINSNGGEKEWTLGEYKSEYGKRALAVFRDGKRLNAEVVCEVGESKDKAAYDPATFSKRSTSATDFENGSSKAVVGCDKTSTKATEDAATMAYGANGHKWVMKGDQPISFDNIVLGTKHQGKEKDGFIVDLEKPYFVFNKVLVFLDDGRIRSVAFDRGFDFFAESSVQNQLTSESMAIAEMICRDIEQQCGVKLESDGRRCHRTYKWYGSGFRRFKLRVNNENDEKPGEAGFSLVCDGGYKYVAN